MSTELADPPKVELKTELALQIRGEIVSSNLPAYAAEIRSFISALPTELENDEDFDGAKQNVKALKTVEEAVKIAREESLKQAQDLYDVLSELDSIGEQGRTTRLKLDKLIKAEDARVKKEIKEEALKLIGGHTFKQEQRIDAAMKGKRLLKTLREAAMKEAELIRNEIIEKRKIISDFLAEHGEKLGYDDGLLMEMDVAALRAELDRRLERQRHEAEQARLKAEADAAKAEAKVAQDRNSEPEKPVETPAATVPATQQVPHGGEPVCKENSHPEGASMSPELEMKYFVDAVPEIFGQFREARLKLKNPHNAAKALMFAKAVNDAWTNFKKSI